MYTVLMPGLAARCATLTAAMAIAHGRLRARVYDPTGHLVCAWGV